ncbi:MAG: cytochrome-c oxidase [Prochlorotrichaceae cyanobacterium]
MIIIEITNVEDLVRQQLGGLGSRLLHAMDMDERFVENAIITQIQETFVQNGVKANLFSVSGPDMLGNGKLEVPLDFKSKDLRLNNCRLEVPIKVRSSQFMS